MRIELVNVGGVLVGRTFESRWNLEMLGVAGPILADRNSAAVKRLRRAHPDFTFTIVRVDRPVPTESLSLATYARYFGGSRFRGLTEVRAAVPFWVAA